MKKLQCFKCEKQLNNIDPDGNQPSSGTEFSTHGHYGSAVTDTMDGIGFAINVCDECVREAAKRGLVLRVYPAKAQPRPMPTYKVWDGKE